MIQTDHSFGMSVNTGYTMWYWVNILVSILINTCLLRLSNINMLVIIDFITVVDAKYWNYFQYKFVQMMKQKHCPQQVSVS